MAAGSAFQCQRKGKFCLHSRKDVNEKGDFVDIAGFEFPFASQTGVRIDSGLAGMSGTLDKNERFLYFRLRIEKPCSPSTRRFARTSTAAREWEAFSS